MRDIPYEAPHEQPDAGTPSRPSTDQPDDVGDRVRARGPGDDDPRQGGGSGTDQGPPGARRTPELTERDVQTRWGQALALDEPSGRSHALADLARRDDVDPDLGHHVANSIVGDDDLRTDVLKELTDKADDPQLARRIANDIPKVDERDIALARLTTRVDPELGHRIANDIGDNPLRTDVLTALADQTHDPQLARRIANDIPTDPRKDRTLARLADRVGPDQPDLAHRIANDIGDDPLRTDVLTVLADQTYDPHLARRIANDIPAEPARDPALARLARRPDVSADLGRRIADDIGDDALRSDTFAELTDRFGNDADDIV
jgi:hypothetical protein